MSFGSENTGEIPCTHNISPSNANRPPAHLRERLPETQPRFAAHEVWTEINIDSQSRGTHLALFDWRIGKGHGGSVVIDADTPKRQTRSERLYATA